MPGAGEGPIPTAEDTGAVAEDGAYTQALDRMADAYVRLIRDAGYSKAVWVGLSMGGYLVLDIQRLYPEAVAGLALCDTKADADSPASRANRLRTKERNGIHTGSKSGLPAWKNHFMPPRSPSLG